MWKEGVWATLEVITFQEYHDFVRPKEIQLEDTCFYILGYKSSNDKLDEKINSWSHLFAYSGYTCICGHYQQSSVTTFETIMGSQCSRQHFMGHKRKGAVSSVMMEPALNQ